MQYVAKPVVVTAYQIAVVGEYMADNGLTLQLENGDYVTATKDMLARMMPKIDDYWVIQEDGYVYINPREVFERKYKPR